MPLEPTIVSTIGDLLIALAREFKGRDKRAADYFDKLAGCLEEMATELKKGKVPSGPGNQFKVLVRNFEKSITGFKAKRVKKDLLDKLHDTLRNADAIDLHYRVYDEKVEEVRNQWLRDMERTSGILRGNATVLRS